MENKRLFTVRFSGTVFSGNIYVYTIYQTLFHWATLIRNWDIVYIGYISIQFTNSKCFWGGIEPKMMDSELHRVQLQLE